MKQFRRKQKWQITSQQKSATVRTKSAMLAIVTFALPCAALSRSFVPPLRKATWRPQMLSLRKPSHTSTRQPPKVSFIKLRPVAKSAVWLNWSATPRRLPTNKRAVKNCKHQRERLGTGCSFLFSVLSGPITFYQGLQSPGPGFPNASLGHRHSTSKPGPFSGIEQRPGDSSDC